MQRPALEHRTGYLPAFLAAAFLAACLGAGCSSDCTNVSVDIGTACLPAVLAADTVASIQVREACGINCARTPQCTAVLSAGSVVLEMSEDQCPDFFGVCASAPCQKRVVGCRLPALPAGDYPMIVPGSPTRLLRVRASGGVSACTLPVASDGGS